MRFKSHHLPFDKFGYSLKHRELIKAGGAFQFTADCVRDCIRCFCIIDHPGQWIDALYVPALWPMTLSTQNAFTVKRRLDPKQPFSEPRGVEPVKFILIAAVIVVLRRHSRRQSCLRSKYQTVLAKAIEGGEWLCCLPIAKSLAAETSIPTSSHQVWPARQVFSHRADHKKT